MTNTRKGASEASPGGAPTQARPEAAGVASGCAQTSNEHAGDNAMHTGSSAGGGAGTAPHALPGARLGACRNFLVAIDAKDVPVSLTAAFYAGWDARERRLANETSASLTALDPIGAYRTTRGTAARPRSSRAEEDVLAERERQVNVEGWTAEHDDSHDSGSLALAAASYAAHAGAATLRAWARPHTNRASEYECMATALWPFDKEWWKPKNRRRDLVRAAALILAEIERLDRAPKRRLSDHDLAPPPISFESDECGQEKISSLPVNRRMWCGHCAKEWAGGNDKGECPLCYGPLRPIEEK